MYIFSQTHLVVTSVSHFGHHQAITTYNLKDWLHVMYIDFKPYGIAFTPIGALIESFISGVLYGQGMVVSSFTIPRLVRQCGRDLKIWWGVLMWTRWWPAPLMHLIQHRHQQETVTLPLLQQRGQERPLTAVMKISPHLPKRARMTNQSKV
jgi:hypothetical protein